MNLVSLWLRARGVSCIAHSLQPKQADSPSGDLPHYTNCVVLVQVGIAGQQGCHSNLFHRQQMEGNGLTMESNGRIGSQLCLLA